MTVSELMQILIKQPADRQVFLAGDPEGNAYGKLMSHDEFVRTPDGEMHNPGEGDANHPELVLVLWP